MTYFYQPHYMNNGKLNEWISTNNLDEAYTKASGGIYTEREFENMKKAGLIK